MDALRAFERHPNVPIEVRNDVEATMDLFGMMLHLFRADVVPVYTEPCDLEDVFEWSERWK